MPYIPCEKGTTGIFSTAHVRCGRVCNLPQTDTFVDLHNLVLATMNTFELGPLFFECQKSEGFCIVREARKRLEAIVDIQHLFRPSHLQMLSNILKDPKLHRFWRRTLSEDGYSQCESQTPHQETPVRPLAWPSNSAPCAGESQANSQARKNIQRTNLHGRHEFLAFSPSFAGRRNPSLLNLRYPVRITARGVQLARLGLHGAKGRAPKHGIVFLYKEDGSHPHGVKTVGV